MGELLLSVDVSAIIFILIATGFVALIASIPVFLSIVFYRWFSKLGYRYVAIVVLLCGYSYLCYSIYTAIYPTDDFYFQEFQTVTLRKVPKSAVIVKKTASYPDFHGDYCSVSLMKLSNEEYSNLLNQIKLDKRFHPEELLGSSELDEVVGKALVHELTTIYSCKNFKKGENYSAIIFCKDKRSIVVYLTVS